MLLEHTTHAVGREEHMHTLEVLIPDPDSASFCSPRTFVPSVGSTVVEMARSPQDFMGALDRQLF